MRMDRLFIFLIGAVIAGCGGGGSDRSEVETVEPSASVKQALAGDWPTPGKYRYYIVQSQEDWQYVWSERLASIDCAKEFNADACNQPQPPAVDFSRYILIGIYLDRYGEFVDLPKSIAVTQEDVELFVKFEATTQDAPLVPTSVAPESVFFLVPTEGKSFNPIHVGPRVGA